MWGFGCRAVEEPGLKPACMSVLFTGLKAGAPTCCSHDRGTLLHCAPMKTRALLLLTFVCCAGLALAQTPRPIALVGGTLVDSTGTPPIHNSVIIIEGGRIKAVGQVGHLAVPANAEVISTEGMTVLPGLWDMHVHLMINGHGDYEHWDKTYPPLQESVIMPASAKQLLLAGVTSARDLGGPLEASINVRDAVNSGKIAGP